MKRFDCLLFDLFLLQVCLQIFQLLPGEVAPLVWGEERGSPALQSILQCLMDIILEIGRASCRERV